MDLHKTILSEQELTESILTRRNISFCSIRNTATVSYLYRSEQISDTNYEYVQCMNETAVENFRR